MLEKILVMRVKNKDINLDSIRLRQYNKLLYMH